MAIKDILEVLKVASQEHAKWELENAQTILKNRKRLLILVSMIIPIILFPIVYAEDLPLLLGGEEAYGPAYSTHKLFFVSIFIGLCAGLITGVIGAGGGFVITPALMSAGVRGILAVGTDLFHIFAKAIMGTILHRKLGNVSVQLAITFVVGSIIGATVGGTINRSIYAMDPILSDVFISTVYVLLLGTLGFYALYDFLKLRKKTPSERGEEKEEGITATTNVAKKIQSIKIPPMITFDKTIVPGGRKVAAIFVAGCGFLVGLAAAIMGVGGGFLTFPMFVYALGISSFTTVGTDIFQIVITAGYASIFQYAIHGFIFYTLAMGLLVGSILGVQIGALTTKVVKGMVIRGFYATVVLAGFSNRLFALPAKLNALGTISISSSLAEGINSAGIVIFFGIISFFAIWVLYTFFTNIKALKVEEA